MRSLNKIILVGNLGSDPELRSTNGGARVATLSLATSESWTKDGVTQARTEWHRVVAWNQGNAKLADWIEQYARKGDRLLVVGKVRYRQWEDKDGQRRYSTEIEARELLFLSSKREGAAAPAPAKAGATAKAASGGEFEDFPGALGDDDDDLPF